MNFVQTHSRPESGFDLVQTKSRFQSGLKIFQTLDKIWTCTDGGQLWFSMTRKGLEHQFLSLAIKSEKPQLEEDMISSVKKEESLRLKVIALEDELLTLLATSEGNILNNDKLIESLKNSKKSTKEAKKTLDEIKETKVKLEDERNIYFTLAQVSFI